MEASKVNEVNIFAKASCPSGLAVTTNLTNHYLREVMSRRGITHLLPVQLEAIDRGLLDRRSLLVCAPSGSGKTLIGELAAISAVLDHRGRAVYLVPYRALAAQKAAEFRCLYESCGIQVVLASGDEEVPKPGLVGADIVVTTFEKLDAALRNAKTQTWVRDLAVVIADEFHEIGEPRRGPHLEVLLMRLLEGGRNVQLVALSATVGNPLELASWLSSFGRPVEPILSDYRPVPLSYNIVTEPRKDLYIRREVMATLAKGGQVLIFTAKRKETEQQAIVLMETCQRFLTPEDEQHLQKATRFLDKIPGHNPNLRQALAAGVGFHHAGLDKGERMTVETLFNERVVKVVCCTTTLAAGINTPARVVILRGVERKKRFQGEGLQEENSSQPTPWITIDSSGPTFLPFPPNQVFQLLGRAGRPGLDTSGRGIILTSSDIQANWAERYYFYPRRNIINEDRKDGRTLINESPPSIQPRYAPLQSQLETPDALRELVLIRIHSLGQATLLDLRKFYRLSLSSFQHRQVFPPSSRTYLSLSVISFLLVQGFIRRVVRPSLNAPLAFEVTRLGSLATRLYVPPSKALLILDVLSKNTPVTPSHLLHLGCDLLNEEEAHGERNILMLERWIAEVPVEDVINNVGKSLGDLAVLNLEVSRYLKIVALFAEYLARPEISKLAHILALRVLHGVKEELLDLATQVPGVGRLRGRLLVNAGYSTPEQIARETLPLIAKKTGISLKILTEIKAQCALIVTDLVETK